MRAGRAVASTHDLHDAHCCNQPCRNKLDEPVASVTCEASAWAPALLSVRDTCSIVQRRRYHVTISRAWIAFGTSWVVSKHQPASIISCYPIAGGSSHVGYRSNSADEVRCSRSVLRTVLRLYQPKTAAPLYSAVFSAMIASDKGGQHNRQRSRRFGGYIHGERHVRMRPWVRGIPNQLIPIVGSLGERLPQSANNDVAKSRLQPFVHPSP